MKLVFHSSTIVTLFYNYLYYLKATGAYRYTYRHKLLFDREETWGRSVITFYHIPIAVTDVISLFEHITSK